MSKFRALLLLSTAIPLAACGPNDVASPGEGNIIVIPPPAAAPPPPPPPPRRPRADRPRAARPAPSTAASSAPARLRAAAAASPADTTIQNLPGVAYSIAGPVNVGTDVGGDGTAGRRPGGDADRPGRHHAVRLVGQRLSGRQPRLADQGDRQRRPTRSSSPPAPMSPAPPPTAARACGAASSCSAARRSATATPPSRAARPIASR